ncbi:MAG: chloride channel protein [Minicystis sp.]
MPRAPLGYRAAAWKRLKRFRRLWRLYWVRVELRLVPTEAQRLFALTMVIGVVCGLVAVAFHLAIRLVEHALIERALEVEGRSWMAWTIITPTLGLAAAFVSVVFTDSLLRLRAWFRRLKTIPPWAQPGVGGMVTGLLAVVAFEALRSRGVTGGGYATLEQALAGSLAVKTMLVLCALKIAATVFSYSSGGAGGIFAPSLFIGGMLGGAIGTLDARLFHHDAQSIGAFALVGMGAVFSGTIRAPMTSMLIIMEMTGGYSLVLPLMIANMTAYGLARHVRPVPVYEALLDQDGIRLRDKAVMDVLEGINLREVMVPGAGLIAFEQTARAREIVSGMGSQDVYPIVDASGVMVGVVTREDIELLRSEPDLGMVVNAADIMRPPISVTADDDLHTVLEAMLSNGVGRLPIVDREGRIEGFVDEAAIAKAYLRGHTSRPD